MPKSCRDEDKIEIQKKIDEGLDRLEKAIEFRPDYLDAMMYLNLLWRENGKMEGDEEAKAELIRKADIAFKKAIQLRLKAQAEKESQRKKLNFDE